MSKKKHTENPATPPAPAPAPGHGAWGRWLGIEGVDCAENAAVVRFGIGFAALAVALRLVFWVYTGRVWEDSLITVLHSENLVSGLGMTHYLGEGEPPLHGFTSPLSVLVPLIGDLFHVGFGLYFIKIVSALVAPLTVLYAMAVAIHPKVKLPAPLAVMVMGYLAVEHHQILWGMAGMETQMTTLVVVMSMYFAIAEMPLPLGISLGFCMLARPDFAFWTVIVGLYALLHYPRRLPVIVGAAVAVYLPWIIFTTIYYGSPVPNTMVAKGLGYPLWTTWPQFNRTPAFVAEQLYSRLTGSYQESIFQPLGPSFAGYGHGYKQVIHDGGLVCNVMLAAALLGAATAVRKRQWVWLPAVLFLLVYSAYYAFCVALVFGWYVSPFIAPVLFLSARGLQAAGEFVRAPRRRAAVLTAFTAAYLACLVLVLPRTFSLERDIQRRVEDGVRKQVGLFLQRVMEKEETVGTEPLGYLSYYSRRIVYDWPGLCCRKVVEYSRTHPRAERTMLDMLQALRPDFLVLRHFEYESALDKPWVSYSYRIIKSYEVPYDPGDTLPKMNWDTGFLILAKNSWHSGATEVNGEALGIRDGDARALNAAGYGLMRRGEAQQARDLLEKAIAACPKYAEPRNNLGLLMNRMGDPAGAVAQFQKAVELNPNFALAHNNLGVSLSDMGDFNNAAKHFREAIRCDAAYVEPLLNLADLIARRGNLDEAKRLFESALKIQPDSQAAADGIRKIDEAMRR